MTRMESAVGMALVCDGDGVVQSVLQNCFDLAIDELVGRQLPAVFGEASLHKSLSFMLELKEHGRFFDCELNLSLKNRAATVHCAGVAFDNGFLVVAAETRVAIQVLFEGMMRVNSDQSTLLRRKAKEQSELTFHMRERDIELFDELTMTNNELVSLQRELQQKNAQLERLAAEVQDLARVDELTGMLNRRGLFEIGHRESAIAKRFAKPLSAIMIDIDHFKACNDTFGHAVGDEVVREVSKRCRKELRDVDVFGRYGGDELSVLLPESDLRTAEVVAERLRSAIGNSAFETGTRSVLVTISLGVANLNKRMNGLEELLEGADRALYRAKQAGRNCVHVYRATGEP